ncbi:MAG: GC-type dockerin domain-anchored protein [Planctomycetota bacterium]
MTAHPVNAIGALDGTACLAALFAAVSACAQDLYYEDTFDDAPLILAGASAMRSGAGDIESVQGFDVLAPLFEGDFLRNTSPGNPAPASVFVLAGLPTSREVSVRFSLAIIDSWDGSSFPLAPLQAPDFFNVTANGTEVFRESFTNLSPLNALQSYEGPALISEDQLGFETGTNREDSAYRIGLVTSTDTSGTLELAFFADGTGWLFGISTGAGPTEESWAIDSLSVRAFCPADVTTTGATLRGQTGYAEPDGTIDLDDLGYFIGVWLMNDAASDLTTTGATLEGQPGFGEADGVVDLDDLGYFIGLWLAGCP